MHCYLRLLWVPTVRVLLLLPRRCSLPLDDGFSLKTLPRPQAKKWTPRSQLNGLGRVAVALEALMTDTQYAKLKQRV